ncbi:MAG: PAS domain-containing protein [Acidimicrobiales bacterium]
MGQKALTLILGREMAANLATPMFLIDAEGRLVFFNEAAEQIIGKTWAEVGEISSLEFGAMLDLQDADGNSLRRRDTPPSVSFNERRPAHAVLLAKSADGSRRLVEVTSFPLFARTDEMHGVVTIFWTVDQ